MAKSKKINYQVTVGYKAIVVFDIKAESEDEAKSIALDKVKVDGIYSGAEIQDETYAADGVLNIDRTWNMVNN